jgi:hypothetical protein
MSPTAMLGIEGAGRADRKKTNEKEFDPSSQTGDGFSIHQVDISRHGVLLLMNSFRFFFWR